MGEDGGMAGGRWEAASRYIRAGQGSGFRGDAAGRGVWCAGMRVGEQSPGGRKAS